MQSTKSGEAFKSGSSPILKASTKSFIINPRKILFYSVFIMVFLLSGIFTLGNFFPYRMGLISLLVFPFVFVYGVKRSHINIAYLALFFVIVISAIYNGSSLLDFFLFSRILIFSFLIYYLVSSYLNQENIVKVVRLCVLIALIQLPIILFQQFIYSYLPDSIMNQISRIDFDFGTFNFKGDSSMAFFLTLIVIFLLFDNKRNHIIKFRWPIVIWLTLTVLIANAEIMKLIIGIIWIIFILGNLSKKTIIYAISAVTLVLVILGVFGVFNQIWADFSRSLKSNSSINLASAEKYLTGNYARGSGIAYLMDQDFLWVGDGPSKYYNVLDRTRLRGNTGHLFTFYSEIGFLGLLISFFIFFLIAFPVNRFKVKFNFVNLLMLFTLLLISFTTEIMNDISIVMIFSIMTLSSLIPVRRTFPEEITKSIPV